MIKSIARAWVENAVADNPDFMGNAENFALFKNETGLDNYQEVTYRRLIRKVKQVFRESNSEWDEDAIAKVSAQNQRCKDQNNLLRKETRETYRLYNTIESLYSDLLDKVEKLTIKCPNSKPKVQIKNRAGILTLADLHINEIINPSDTSGNVYNYEIFSKRLKKLVDRAVVEFKHRSISEVYVFLLGDFINSPRRLDERISMQSSLTNACLLAVDVIGQAISELGQYFNVHVAYCIGNESRITEEMYSNKMLAMENWDYLIFQILQLTLTKKGIDFIPSTNPVQNLIPIKLDDNNTYNAFITHGHIFKGIPDERNVGAILQNYAHQGITVHGIFLGHFHNTRIGDFIQVSGSMKGGDAWSFNNLGFTSRAAQNIFFINPDMTVDALRVDLQHIEEDYPMFPIPEAFNEDAAYSKRKTYTTVISQNLI